MTEFDLASALLQDYAAKHQPIKQIYERYKHLDMILSDPAWTHDEWEDDTELGLHHVLYDCWQAIKVAMEEREK